MCLGGCGYRNLMNQQTQSSKPESATTDDVSGRTQSEVEGDLGEQGYSGQFGAREGGQVLCFSCRHEFPALELDATDASRVEGESDPADMAIVVPVTCPVCGVSGSLSLQYGPGAGEAESEVVAALNREASVPIAHRPGVADHGDRRG